MLYTVFVKDSALKNKITDGRKYGWLPGFRMVLNGTCGYPNTVLLLLHPAAEGAWGIAVIHTAQRLAPQLIKHGKTGHADAGKRWYKSSERHRNAYYRNS